MSKNDSETKIELERKDGKVRTITNAPEEDEYNMFGVKTCCRIYDGDTFLTCKGINEPTRFLADAKCVWHTLREPGATTGYNSRGECGDFPECHPQ